MKIFPPKKKVNFSDVSPRPRLKTPEPIQTTTEKYSISTIKQGSKISHLPNHKRQLTK